LFAAGEVTGGVHGSDRPGGNNLSDTQVFGYRAGRAAALAARENEHSLTHSVEALAYTEEENGVLSEAARLYYRRLTVIRDAEGLRSVLDFINAQEEKIIGMPLKNRLTVGRLLASAMDCRRESRGTHYREDYPAPQCGPPYRLLLQKGASGPTVIREPVNKVKPF